MQALNTAIEDAARFRALIDKIEHNASDDLQRMRDAAAPEEARRFTIAPDRQPGENRAAHRARLKNERRAAKSGKVGA